MTEREQDEKTSERNWFYRKASTAEGFVVELHAEDVFSIQLARGEVTLFIKSALAGPGVEDEKAVEASPERETQVANRTERETRRLRIRGRLASEPQYAPLPRRGLRVSFVVAARHADAGTIFHRAYATGDYARRIQAKNPVKGDEVTIDGERHVNRIRQADGGVKESPLLYCYGLRVRVSPRRNG